MINFPNSGGLNEIPGSYFIPDPLVIFKPCFMFSDTIWIKILWYVRSIAYVHLILKFTEEHSSFHKLTFEQSTFNGIFSEQFNATTINFCQICLPVVKNITSNLKLIYPKYWMFRSIFRNKGFFKYIFFH